MNRLAAFALGSLVVGCSSDGDTRSVSYDALGNLQVNALTGTALNGDPFGRDVDGSPVRWRVATSTWEHVGNKLAGAQGTAQMAALFEGADGTIYGTGPVLGPHLITLSPGATEWQTVPIPDGGTDWESPHANSKGDIVVQVLFANRARRVYRKNAGAADFTVAVAERPDDGNVITGMADSGDVFFQQIGDAKAAMVLPAAGNALGPVLECATTIAEACNLPFLMNARGDLVFYAGIGQWRMYRMDATTQYPAKAHYLFDRPEVTCCLNGGQGLLDDGTIFARMNDGTYDPYSLYVRAPGDSDWTVSTLPLEDGFHSVDVLTDRHAAIYTWSISLGAVLSTGPAYRVRL